MENRRSMGSIVAIVGGVALAIGAFLTWATVSFDLNAFASLLGVDPGSLGGAIGDTSKSFSGLQAGADGGWALAMGIIAIALGILLFAWKRAHRAIAIGIVVAGLVGGGFALYDISQVDNAKQDGIDQVAPQFEALGVDTSTLNDVFDISLGIGIWVCTIGGLLAIVGGLIVLTSGEPASDAEGATTAMGGGMAMGSAMGGDMTMPPPVAPTPTMTPPAPTMPPTEPSSPPAGGEETSSTDGRSEPTT